MGRPRKSPADRKGKNLFARAPEEMVDAFHRYCEEVCEEAPSVVLRRLVRDALRDAGYTSREKTARRPALRPRKKRGRHRWR